jgi:glycosyltransferase involved in cell wall biosynthesis
MRHSEKKTNISHFIGLRGIGGVQTNFTEYLNNETFKNSELFHKVYTFGSKDSEYVLNVEVLNIWKLTNLYLFIRDIISNKTIVHFYNNLSSTKVMFLLIFLSAKKIVMHERGTCWNQSKKYCFITRFNASKADVIISNSKATKTMLVKRFLIPKDKINIIHNGIKVDINNYNNKQNKNIYGYFRVGFIGRLDSPKGLHVLIEAIEKLKEHKIELLIAGSGPLNSELKEQSKDLINITFLGRIQQTSDFFKSLDLLVVPSIREPLGNVCIEAGLYRVPVLASNVDGIPEILEHEISGELMNPDINLSFESNNDAAPIPEYVINPETQELQKPRQLDSFKLANKILELSLNHDKLDLYANNLHSKVIQNFNIEAYSLKLERLYKKLNSENR